MFPFFFYFFITNIRHWYLCVCDALMCHCTVTQWQSVDWLLTCCGVGVCLYWWVEDRPSGAWTTSCLAIIPLSKSLSWQSLYETGCYPRLYMYRSSLLSCVPHKGRGVTIDSAAALGPWAGGPIRDLSTLVYWQALFVGVVYEESMFKCRIYDRNKALLSKFIIWWHVNNQ